MRIVVCLFTFWGLVNFYNVLLNPNCILADEECNLQFDFDTCCHKNHYMWKLDVV